MHGIQHLNAMQFYCIARAVYKCSIQVSMQPYKCIHLSKRIQFECKESSAWSQRTANGCFRAIPLLVFFLGGASGHWNTRFRVALLYSIVVGYNIHTCIYVGVVFRVCVYKSYIYTHIDVCASICTFHSYHTPEYEHAS